MIKGIYLTVLGLGCFALGYYLRPPSEGLPVLSETTRALAIPARAVMPPTSESVMGSSAVGTSTTLDLYGELCRQLELINPPVCMEAKRSIGKMTFELLFGALCKADPVSMAKFLDATPDLPGKGSLCSSVALNWGVIDAHDAYKWLVRQRATMSVADYHACERTLLCSLAATDPALVSTFLSGIDDNEIRAQVLAALTDGWLRKDPAAAFNWLKTLSGDPEDIRECYCTIMNRYIQLDPWKAAQAISELKSGDLQMQLVPAVAQKIAETDFSGAVKWLRSLVSRDACNAGFAALIDSRMASSPAASIDLLFASVDSSPGGLSVMKDVFKRLAATDLSLAVERFDKAPPAVQPSIAESITSIWMRQDLTRALDWLNTQPAGSVHDSGVAVAARYLMGVDPGSAIQWASSLGDADARMALLKELVGQSSGLDLPALQRALPAAALSSIEMDRIRQEIAERMANVSPDLVFP